MGFSNYRSPYGEDVEEAQFNMGITTLMRINQWLNTANQHSYEKDMSGWFDALEILYTEISPFLNKTEKEEQDKVEANCEKHLKTHSAYLKTLRSHDTPMPPREIYDSLRHWDRDIRKLMLRYKLYMKMEDQQLAAMKT